METKKYIIHLSTILFIVLILVSLISVYIFKQSISIKVIIASIIYIVIWIIIGILMYKSLNNNVIHNIHNLFNEMNLKYTELFNIQMKCLDEQHKEFRDIRNKEKKIINNINIKE